MAKIKNEQIDAELHSASLGESKTFPALGCSVSYKVDTYGTDKSMANEKVLLALIELSLMIENEIGKLEL